LDERRREWPTPAVGVLLQALPAAAQPSSAVAQDRTTAEASAARGVARPPDQTSPAALQEQVFISLPFAIEMLLQALPAIT
jgi:hypothetical protein